MHTARLHNPRAKIHLAQFHCGAESRTNKRNWTLVEPDVTCTRCQAAIEKYHAKQAQREKKDPS